jgi:hypothetical protein
MSKNTLKTFENLLQKLWVKFNKLGTNYPWMKGIQVCSNKGPGPFQKGDNHKKCENRVGSFENLLLQNRCANFNQTWHKSSEGRRNKV